MHAGGGQLQVRVPASTSPQIASLFQRNKQDHPLSIRMKEVLEVEEEGKVLFI